MILLPVLLFANSIHPAVPDIPYRQPQLSAAHGIVGLTFGAGSSIYFALSGDKGESFAPPVKVAEAGALALGRHRGPRVVILKDSILISAVAAEKVATGPGAHGLPDNGNLAVWQSKNRGQSWKRISVINDVPGAAREGLHAMAAGPDGSVFAVWLDLRAEGTKLFGSRSKDGGVTWSKNIEVYSSPDGTICSCCHPALTMEASGRIWAMWRNVIGGSRDLYVAHSDDGLRFDAVTKEGHGTWKLNACPMDGGGFVVDDGKVTSAWRRETDIYIAEPGMTEKRLGPGKDVAITRTAKGPYVAWTNGGAITAKTPNSAEPQTLAENGAFVTLLALPDGAVLAAWESAGSIETKRLH